jgi:hypothetical protein
LESKKVRESQFSGLVAFANLGNTVDDWRRFRLMYPHFFPETPFNWRDIAGFHDMTDWLYTQAEEWAKVMADWASKPEVITEKMPTTPLLWYRNRLRTVWARNDPDSINLMILYGLEKEALEKGRRLGSLQFEGLARHVIPGEIPSEAFEKRASAGGMPPGHPEVDGISGEMRWEFGCQFQRSVHELMKHRWRAMICPMCGRCFVADKSAQKHCSTPCYADNKRKHARDRWTLKGNAERKARTRKARLPGSSRRSAK